MTAARTWLLAIGGLLAANMIATIGLAVFANNGTNQVIPDYYARAAHYDDEMARSSVSKALGWHVVVAIADGAINVIASDAKGAPLGGARVRITGYQRAHVAEPLDLVLPAAGPGLYRIASQPRAGWYDLIASVELGGAHYTQHVVAEAR